MVRDTLRELVLVKSLNRLGDGERKRDQHAELEKSGCYWRECDGRKEEGGCGECEMQWERIGGGGGR